MREGRLLLPRRCRAGRTRGTSSPSRDQRKTGRSRTLTANQIGSAITTRCRCTGRNVFKLAGVEARLPICEKTADEVLSIPIYPELSTEQIDHVINTIANALI